jgi:lipoprotein-anchoring transpeptidase ErfK/SrfK
MTDRDRHIRISLNEQLLYLVEGGRTLKTYPVSTAGNGPGELQDSGCTPRGRHAVAAKIGQGCEPGTVFVGRKPTGETYSPALREAGPGRDWILTRILRLEGLEEGVNRGGGVDTYARLIYIHGAPDETPLGIPGSLGCVRMRNQDVIELFDSVEEGTLVEIEE